MNLSEIDNYRFDSLEDPTDEMLDQIMSDMIEKVKIRNQKANEKYFQQMKEYQTALEKKYEKQLKEFGENE